MSEIWSSLVECQQRIIMTLDRHCLQVSEPNLKKFNQPENGWVNLVWRGEHVRRGHVDVVDARKTKGLWMMHVCVFPNLDNNSPIYGFDVIAGKNKVTGAFHDFSTTTSDETHPLNEWFAEGMADYFPSKPRTLPEWATNIFSSSMLAAGNITDVNEIDSIIDFAVNNLEVYLQSLGDHASTADPKAAIVAQNYYCQNQQQNPHTPRVMKSLGLNEDDVNIFCRDVLFPTIT